MKSEIWDDIGRKMSKAADTVGKKASKATELMRFKNQIYSLEREIEKDYADLGKMIYERYLNQEGVEEAFRPGCESIAQKEILMTEYQNEVENLKREM